MTQLIKPGTRVKVISKDESYGVFPELFDKIGIVTGYRGGDWYSVKFEFDHKYLHDDDQQDLTNRTRHIDIKGLQTIKFTWKHILENI